MEDILWSPMATQQIEDLLKECEHHNEFHYVSIDGTYKICNKIVGQVSIRAPLAIKAQQSMPEDETRRVLQTARGATGAVFALELTHGDTDEEVARPFLQLTTSQRAQVRHVACDDPSNSLLLQVQHICVNVSSMSLDPTHLAITYESGTAEHKSPRSRMLRKMMH
eukprot:4085119-Karenia_brevis.AAC.1